jgi:fructose/tagatose bisphosphate aldolase
MSLVSMSRLLDEAASGGYGVGASNVNEIEQIQGVTDAARETASPVIVQALRGEPLPLEEMRRLYVARERAAVIRAGGAT